MRSTGQYQHAAFMEQLLISRSGPAEYIGAALYDETSFQTVIRALSYGEIVYY